MGEQTKADVVSMRLADGDKLTIEGLALDVIYTPGHTDDSYSFIMPDRVFTGDTLLIRGTGRTDFQNGDPRQQYESIFGRLLKLPDETLVYPAHDYKGDTVSTIGEERALQSAPAGEVGRGICRADEQPEARQPEDDGRRGAGQHEGRAGAGGDRAARLGAYAAGEALALVGKPDVALIDLRERSERERHGIIPGALHVPYPALQENIRRAACCMSSPNRPASGSLFYCAFGERSAMAVQAAQDAGLTSACHIQGGIDAWKKASGPLVP